MTINDIIAKLQKIPSRERERPICLCGDAINKKSEEELSELEIEWIDCSDAIVLILNKTRHDNANC